MEGTASWLQIVTNLKLPAADGRSYETSVANAETLLRLVCQKAQMKVATYFTALH